MLGIQFLSQAFNKLKGVTVFRLYLSETKINDQALIYLLDQLLPNLGHLQEIYLDFKK